MYGDHRHIMRYQEASCRLVPVSAVDGSIWRCVGIIWSAKNTRRRITEESEMWCCSGYFRSLIQCNIQKITVWCGTGSGTSTENDAAPAPHCMRTNLTFHGKTRIYFYVGAENSSSKLQYISVQKTTGLVSSFFFTNQYHSQRGKLQYEFGRAVYQ
jgi:hypothetical protein